jgi:drug/metabolite transporter (DMT)-like permease
VASRREEESGAGASDGAADARAAESAPEPAAERSPPLPRRAIAPPLLLVIGILGMSTSSLWARLSESGPAELAFRRLILTVPILWLLARRRAGRAPPAAVARGAVLASGISLAIHFAAYFAALERLSAAVTLVVVSLHPVFLVAIEALRGAVRLDRGRIAGVSLALAGTVWLAREELLRDDGSATGVILGLVSALAMVGYLLGGRVACRVLPPTEYARRCYGVAEWRIAALLAIFPTLLGHTPLNAALRSLPASVVSTAYLGEVVGASLLVWAFLHEVPPDGFWAGGAAIIAGIAIVATAGSRTGRSPAG